MATLRDLKVHMPTVYGSSYEDMGKRVQDKYPNDSWQQKLQWAWAAWKTRGGTIEQFRNMWVTQAEVLDGAWTYEAPNNLASGYQNTYTQVILPKGRFLMNAMVNIPRGGMIGESSFGYAGNGSDQGQVATEFILDENWIGSGAEQRMFQTPNADRTDNYAYNESFQLVGIRLTCPSKKAGITRIGWFIKRPGSTTWLNQLQANNFNKGFVNVDGVPVVYGTIRSFTCDVGFSCEGTWGARIDIMSLECDNCTRAFQTIGSSEGAAGGKIRLGLKVEDGVTAGLPIANTTALWLEGQYLVEVFANLSYANGAKPANGLVVLSPTIGKDSSGNEQKQSSLLIMSAGGYGYGNKLVRNALTGKEWTSPGDYAAYRFEHYAKQDQLYSNCQDIGGATSGGGSTGGGTGGGTTPPPAKLTAKAFAEGTEQGVLRSAVFAVDGDPNTFWISGVPMTATGEQTFVVTADKPIVANTFSFSVGNYTNSYPRSFDIAVAGADGVFVTKLQKVPGAAVCTVALGGVTCSAIRITCKAANSNWWAISSVSIS